MGRWIGCVSNLKWFVWWWNFVIKFVPRAIRRRPRYKSDAWQPMPNTGLRGDDGWKRGDRVTAADESVDIDADELFVNIDDMDDDDKFVNGASAYPLPIKPLRLIGVAKLKPFCNCWRGCGIFRIFGESNDKSEPAVAFTFCFIDFQTRESRQLNQIVSIVDCKMLEYCPDLHNDGKFGEAK